MDCLAPRDTHALITSVDDMDCIAARDTHQFFSPPLMKGGRWEFDLKIQVATRAIAFNFPRKSPQSVLRRLFPSLHGGVYSGGCRNTECPASKSIAIGDAITRHFRRRGP